MMLELSLGYGQPGYSTYATVINRYIDEMGSQKIRYQALHRMHGFDCNWSTLSTSSFYPRLTYSMLIFHQILPTSIPNHNLATSTIPSSKILAEYTHDGF